MASDSKTLEVGQSINDPALRKLINTDLDDYFDTKLNSGHHKCIDCAKCLYPTGGKMIRYKYPHNVRSGKSNFPIFEAPSGPAI